MSDPHTVTIERHPHHRVWVCSCGWTSEPTPYAQRLTTALDAIRHAAQLEQEQTQ